MRTRGDVEFSLVACESCAKTKFCANELLNPRGCPHEEADASEGASLLWLKPLQMCRLPRSMGLGQEIPCTTHNNYMRVVPTSTGVSATFKADEDCSDQMWFNNQALSQLLV